MMNLKQCIGLRVKVARRAEKLSQEKLAEKIERTTETVSNIERAVTLPNIETLERLSKVLNVPMLEFFEAYETPKSDKKRMHVEMDIRQCLKKLSQSGLEIARVQVQALVNMGEVSSKDNSSY